MLTSVWVHRGRHELIPIVKMLFEEYQEELDIDLCFQGFEEELRNLPGKYGPPKGALLLILDGSAPVGCGALKDLGDSVCELKRIYVRPQYRNVGVGKDITLTLLEHADSLRYTTARLDSLKRLVAAIRLYERLGFRLTEPYNHNPEPDVVYMERPVRLTSS